MVVMLSKGLRVHTLWAHSPHTEQSIQKTISSPRLSGSFFTQMIYMLLSFSLISLWNQEPVEVGNEDEVDLEWALVGLDGLTDTTPSFEAEKAPSSEAETSSQTKFSKSFCLQNLFYQFMWFMPIQL